MTGYLFRDGLTGRLWPRFSDLLNTVDSFPIDSDRIRIDIGNKGSPDRQDCYPLPSSLAECEMPTARDSLRAYADWITDGAHFEETVRSDYEEEPMAMDFIGAFGEPVYLHTYAYTPTSPSLDEMTEADAKGDVEWYVADPWGLGSSSRLRRDFVNCAQSNATIRKQIESLLPSVEVTSISEHMNAFVQNARASIDLRFPLTVRDLPFYEAIFDLAVEEHEVKAHGRQARLHMLAGLVVQAAVVVEELFRWLLTIRPMSATEHLPREQMELESFLSQCALELGFEGGLHSTFARQKYGRLRQAAGGNGRSFSACVALALVNAHFDEGHPLRSASGKAPNLLVRLGALADLRAQCAHRSQPPNLDFEQMEVQIETVWLSIQLLAFST